MGCVTYNRGMRAHIWIRKEDESAWNTIKDRPEWLHAMLNNQVTPIASVIRLIKESGALETDATLQQFVDYCESISKIEGDKHGK